MIGLKVSMIRQRRRYVLRGPKRMKPKKIASEMAETASQLFTMHTIRREIILAAIPGGGNREEENNVYRIHRGLRRDRFSSSATFSHCLGLAICLGVV